MNRGALGARAAAAVSMCVWLAQDYADVATGAAEAEEAGVSADAMLERYETFVGLRPTKRQRKGPSGKGKGKGGARR